MTYLKFKALNRELKCSELAALSREVEEIECHPSDCEDWLCWADDRLEEIILIMTESHRMARMRELGLRVIQGGAA